MTDSYIQLPTDGTGKKTRSNLLDIDGVSMHQQVVQIADSAGTAVDFSTSAKQDDIISVILNQGSYYIEAMSYGSNGMIEYLGRAVPGSLKSVAAWQIKKFTYDGQNLTDTGFADGDILFDNIWNNRAGYDYK